MTIQRMDHVGVVVDDLAAARAFFLDLGLEPRGEGEVEDGWVDRVVGLDGIRVQFAMLATPDGHGRLELVKFHAPSGPSADRHLPANVPGLRHLAFVVDDIDAVLAGVRAHDAELVGEVERYGNAFRLCYVRGPGGDHRRAGRADRLALASAGGSGPEGFLYVRRVLHAVGWTACTARRGAGCPRSCDRSSRAARSAPARHERATGALPSWRMNAMPGGRVDACRPTSRSRSRSTRWSRSA